MEKYLCATAHTSETAKELSYMTTTTNQKETHQSTSLNSPIGGTASDLELPITTPMASDELSEAQIGMFIVWMEMGLELGFDASIRVDNDTITIQSKPLASAIKLRVKDV
jgi:hypothetical protein